MTDPQKDLERFEAYGQELIERMSANGIEMSTMVALAQVDSAICAIRQDMRDESRPAVYEHDMKMCPHCGVLECTKCPHVLPMTQTIPQPPEDK